MHMKKMIFRRWIAAVAALLMVFASMPFSLAATDDWMLLQITVNWTDQWGNSMFAAANPLMDYDSVFWAKIPEEAFFADVTLDVMHVNHPEWQYYINTSPTGGDAYLVPVGTPSSCVPTGTRYASPPVGDVLI